ncbi:MAG: HAMP domain-containing protein [Roseiflexaceae bacterium]
MIAMTIAALFATNNLRTEVSHTLEDIPTLISASDRFTFHISRANGESQVFALGGGDEDLDEAAEDLEAAAEQLVVIEAMTERLNTAHHADLNSQLREITLQRQTIYQETAAVVESLEAQATNGARVDLELLEDQLEELERSMIDVDQRSGELLGAILIEINAAIATDLQWNQIGFGVVTTLTVILTLVGVLILQRRVVRPISTLSNAADKIIAGQYEQQVVVTNSDEIGMLQQSFNTMIATLNEQRRELQNQVHMAQQARVSAEQAQQLITAQLTTISEQRTLISEMDVPVIPVTDSTLVIPLVGVIDENRIANLTNRALQAVADQRANTLILDVTGIVAIDQQVAKGLIGVLNSARLLGARTVLVGMRPEVSQTIVQLGISFQSMRTYSTLRNALANLN